ncbi:MAG: hypothetical protein V8T16_01820 [Parabacteroides merdae]
MKSPFWRHSMSLVAFWFMVSPIPLPKAIVAGEVEKLKKPGVNVMTDILIGKTISIDELFDEYGFDAVFVRHRRWPAHVHEDPRRRSGWRLLR